MARWDYKLIPIKTRVNLNSLNEVGKPVIDHVHGELDNLGKVESSSIMTYATRGDYNNAKKRI